MGETINLEEVMRSVYKLFTRFDKDGSETLEFGELHNFLKACEIPVNAQECKAIIEQMDINNDGGLDFAEFMSFLGLVFKVRFSKQTRLKDEFQAQTLKSLNGKEGISKPRRRRSKPPPPPERKTSLPS